MDFMGSHGISCDFMDLRPGDCAGWFLLCPFDCTLISSKKCNIDWSYNASYLSKGANIVSYVYIYINIYIYSYIDIW